MIPSKAQLQDKTKPCTHCCSGSRHAQEEQSMLNLTTRTQKWIHMGFTLALGATLFLSGPAGADNPYPAPEPPKDDYSYCTKFEQVYAYTEFSKEGLQPQVPENLR
jgi:hypothetical protein